MFFFLTLRILVVVVHDGVSVAGFGIVLIGTAAFLGIEERLGERVVFDLQRRHL